MIVSTIAGPAPRGGAARALRPTFRAAPPPRPAPTNTARPPAPRSPHTRPPPRRTARATASLRAERAELEPHRSGKLPSRGDRRRSRSVISSRTNKKPETPDGLAPAVKAGDGSRRSRPFAKPDPDKDPAAWKAWSSSPRSRPETKRKRLRRATRRARPPPKRLALSNCFFFLKVQDETDSRARVPAWELERDPTSAGRRRPLRQVRSATRSTARLPSASGRLVSIRRHRQAPEAAQGTSARQAATWVADAAQT